MPVRNASAVWEGNLPSGRGTLTVGSGAFEGSYSFASRFEDGPGTNPDELIGAAHAGCFSMALANMLAQAGHTPESIRTEAKVQLAKVGDGFKITLIELNTEGIVPGTDEKTFLKHAENAKTGCPVSQALAGVEVRLLAKLAE